MFLALSIALWTVSGVIEGKSTARGGLAPMLLKGFDHGVIVVRGSRDLYRENAMLIISLMVVVGSWISPLLDQRHAPEHRHTLSALLETASTAFIV